MLSVLNSIIWSSFNSLQQNSMNVSYLRSSKLELLFNQKSQRAMIHNNLFRSMNWLTVLRRFLMLRITKHKFSYLQFTVLII